MVGILLMLIGLALMFDSLNKRDSGARGAFRSGPERLIGLGIAFIGLSITIE